MWRWLSFLRCALAWLAGGAGAATSLAAGVTLITHGQSGNVTGWIAGMADSVPYYPLFAGTNVIHYTVRVTGSGTLSATATRVAGAPLATDPHAEIVIRLDWSGQAGLFNQFDTEAVAAAVAPRLLQTNFIAELGGRALAELPLHLIGHSRGASLMCALSRHLGTNGVWVDQVTTLDPHPVNNDGNVDPLFVTDAPLRIYTSVLFADNYFQEFGGYPDGQFMGSSYNRQLFALPGGYSSAHSDMHLWYHATLDLYEPAWDYEAYLHATNRLVWYTAHELNGARAGYHYSRVGGGDRFSTNRPAGGSTDPVRIGYNQHWDLGAGFSPNRTPLPANNGNWPNVIRLNLAGANQLAHGQTGAVNVVFQWARPASSNAVISLHLDDDFNPFNGNDRVAAQFHATGTTANNLSAGAVPFVVNATNAPPGVHSIYAKVTGGGRTRYLYAPETLTVVSSHAPPALTIARAGGGQVRVDVTGVAGQRVVLQASADLQAWQPIATNWLGSGVWSLLDDAASAPRRFYRAILP